MANREGPFHLTTMSGTIAGPLPGHRADIATLHLAKAEEEPLPDRRRELVFRYWDETEGLVKSDKDNSRMDEDLFSAARIDECLDGEPGIALSAELLTGKDAIHLKTVRVPGTPGRSRKDAVFKNPEDTLVRHVVLLAAVLFPKFLSKREFCMVQLAYFNCRPGSCHIPENLHAIPI